jgi:uncharacterized membrane protein YkvA (DUF1232 family)
MPKSGSTFLSDVISQLPGFQRAVLYPSSDRREQELDEFCLRQVNKFDYVAQSHSRYSEWTADMCRAYDLKPIILVRSLLDVVVSLRDHVRKQSHIWPMFFAEPPHASLDDATLELMLARLATPWYVNFYMGWRQAPDTLMVSYEELIREPVKTVRDILTFSGAAPPLAEIEAAVEAVRRTGRSRLNVGVAGRGAKLRPRTIRAVLELLDFYPEAAEDPYVVAVKAQGRAALAGDAEASWPRTVALAPRKHTHDAVSAVRHWLRKKAKRVLLGRIAPIVVVLLGLLYWRWPNDLMPDQGAYGHVDDGLVLLIAGFAAGRFVYRGAQQRLRRATFRRPAVAAIAKQGS